MTSIFAGILLKMQKQITLDIYLNLLDLQHNVKKTTHGYGHIIDFVITRTDDVLSSNWKKEGSLSSDHHAIHSNLKCYKPYQLKILQLITRPMISTFIIHFWEIG